MKKTKGILEFIQTNLFLILGIIFIVPWVKKYLDKMELANKKNEIENEKDETFLVNQNMTSQNSLRDKITKNKGVQAAATKIANDLGTSINHDTGSITDILNPRGWTENDEEVANTIIYQRNNFPFLEKLYNQTETRQRKLREDLIKLLDVDQMKRIKKYIKI